MSDSLSIFMPFYNDAGTVALMITEAYEFGGRLTQDLEVIAVNDGSADDTLQQLKMTQQKFPDLKIVDHAQNRGYGGAIMSGIAHTTKKWVFYTDGDAQYRLNEISKLWDLRDNYDVINGYKISRSDNVARKLVGSCYSWAIKRLFKSPIRDIDCDYRLMKGDVLRSLDLHCLSGAITVELIKKLNVKTDRFKDVGVRHYDRVYGKSEFFTVSNIIKTFKEEGQLLMELRAHFKTRQ
jgi:glycosyltransferase involved in cell wall biosynthesis